jgi:hypothetical protein
MSELNDMIFELMELSDPLRVVKNEAVLYYFLKMYPKRTVKVLGNALTQEIVDKAVFDLDHKYLIKYLPVRLITPAIFQRYVDTTRDFFDGKAMSEFEPFLTQEIVDKLLHAGRVHPMYIPNKYLTHKSVSIIVDYLDEIRYKGLLDNLTLDQLKVLVSFMDYQARGNKISFDMCFDAVKILSAY